MPPETPSDVAAWAWIALNAYVVVLLLLDLLVFNRKAHKIEFGEAARLSVFFIATALAVNAAVWWGLGHDAGVAFLTGYIVEKSLSVDNLFVIAVLFGFFAVPAQYQHRVLFWGIFGAIVMRAAMILLGVALLERFSWLLYVFGAFLVFTGLKLFRDSGQSEDIANNRLLTLLRRVIPVTETYHEEHFFVRRAGVLWATPLFLVLVMIELTDVVFAVDSIPAILGVMSDPALGFTPEVRSFLAYGSNIMAVVGLRALYFLLAGIIERVRYLHIGLGLVLVFIGGKMLAEPFVGHLPTEVSLLVIAACLGTAVAVSSAVSARERRRAGPAPPPGVVTDDGSSTPPDASPERLVHGDGSQRSVDDESFGR